MNSYDSIYYDMNSDALVAVTIAVVAYFVLMAVFFILAIGLSQFKGFTRADVKKRGWESLTCGKYWIAFSVSLVASILAGGISFNYSSADSSTFATEEDYLLYTTIMLVVAIVLLIVSVAITVFVSNIITVGMNRFFIMNLDERPGFTELFFGFKNGKYLKVFSVMFFRSLYIFLWSLLFIIPGIVKTYEYFMVPYILAENPDIDRKEAFRLSKTMMHGHKWNTYVLGLSFIGWELLGVLCCCVGSVFVAPYVNATYAALYEKLRNNLSESDIEMYLSNDIFKKSEPEMSETTNSYNSIVNNNETVSTENTAVEPTEEVVDTKTAAEETIEEPAETVIEASDDEANADE